MHNECFTKDPSSENSSAETKVQNFYVNFSNRDRNRQTNRVPTVKHTPLAALTFFLVQHVEWLQQLMFGTLHHAQPGLSLILKRSEVTDDRSEGVQLEI